MKEYLGVKETDKYNDIPISPLIECITLREHYAGLAMQGLISFYGAEGNQENGNNVFTELAARSFEIADAMLTKGWDYADEYQEPEKED